MTSFRRSASQLHGGTKAAQVGALGSLAVLWLFLPLISVEPSLVPVLGIFGFTAVQWWSLKVRTKEQLPPVAVLLALLNAAGVLGYQYYRAIQSEAQVSFHPPDSPAVYNTAAEIFLVASLSLWGGGMLVGGRPREPIRTGRPAAAVLGTMNARAVWIIATVPMALAVMGYGPAALLERPDYLAHSGPNILLSAASLFLPAGAAVLSFALFGPHRTPGERFGFSVLLGVYSFTLFCMGTRQLAVLPSLLLVSWRANPTRQGLPRRLSLRVLLPTAVATILLIALPLNIRGSAGSAGAVPFLAYITSHPAMAATPRVAAIAGNILVAVPLSSTVRETASGALPLHYFLTSINPLPGAFTDWESIYPELGLNRATPFSALGELAAYGWPILVGYLLVVGFLLSLAQRINSSLPPAARTMVSVATAAMTVLLGLDLLQYNLRSGARLIWYVIALTFLANVIHKFRVEPARHRPRN
jgi:hypothetical protein